MENVARAVERDFYQWNSEQEDEQNRKRRDTLQERMEIYLREKFDIGDDDPSVLGI